jgi:hypothetical protein
MREQSTKKGSARHEEAMEDHCCGSRRRCSGRGNRRGTRVRRRANVRRSDNNPDGNGHPRRHHPTAEPRDERDQDQDRRWPVRRYMRFTARALHGEVTLAGEKHRVIVFQRGTVDNANSESVTVKSNDGFVETYLLSEDTKVREHRKDASVSDIDASDRVLVVATQDGSTLNARRVVVRDD